MSPRVKLVIGTVFWPYSSPFLHHGFTRNGDRKYSAVNPALTRSCATRKHPIKTNDPSRLSRPSPHSEYSHSAVRLSIIAAVQQHLLESQAFVIGQFCSFTSRLVRNFSFTSISIVMIYIWTRPTRTHIKFYTMHMKHVACICDYHLSPLIFVLTFSFQ